MGHQASIPPIVHQGLIRRYPSWSEDKADEILRLVHMGTPLVSAAASAGVPESTFRRWRKKIPIFEESLQVARAAAVTGKVAIVAMAAQGHGIKLLKCPEKGCPGVVKVPAVKGIWTAAAWWLERTHHEEFGRKDILESKIDVRVKLEVHKFATLVVQTINEEVPSVSIRERIQDRLLERLGLPSPSGHPDGGPSFGAPALSDAPARAPQGTA